MRNSSSYYDWCWYLVWPIAWPIKFVLVYVRSEMGKRSGLKFLETCDSDHFCVDELDHVISTCYNAQEEYGIDYTCLIEKLKELKVIAELKG